MKQRYGSKIRDVLASIEWKGQNLISSGAVVDIAVSEGTDAVKANLVVQIEATDAKNMSHLKQQIQEAVEGISGITDVAIVFTAHKDKEAPKASDKLELAGVKRVIAVISGKGGVGKSTVSANLAGAFAAKGHKVGLVDADVYGPSIPKMFGVSEKPAVGSDKKLIPIKKHGISLMSIGFMVGEDSPMIWRGPMVHGAVMQLFRDVDWGELDVLIVDMPPGTGDAHITLSQKIPLSGAIVVSTPQDIALIDARKGIAMMQRVGIPILGLIENMSYFTCPCCGERSEIFGNGGAKAEAEKQGVPFLGEVPIDIAIRHCSDKGEILPVFDPDCAASKAYIKIAEQLCLLR